MRIATEIGVVIFCNHWRSACRVGMVAGLVRLPVQRNGFDWKHDSSLNSLNMDRCFTVAHVVPVLRVVDAKRCPVV